MDEEEHPTIAQIQNSTFYFFVSTQISVHCRVVINGKEITFKVVDHPTMYDGKSITAITKLILNQLKSIMQSIG